MNKKFSTLMMAGMLVAGPSFVGAQDAVTLNGKPLKPVAFPTKNEDPAFNKKNVVIVRDVNDNGIIDQGDLALTASKNFEGKLTYRSVAVDAKGNIASPNEKDAIWDFNETSYGDITGATSSWTYSLWNHSTGCFLAVDYSTKTKPTIVEEANKSKEDSEAKTSVRFATEATGNVPPRIKYDQASVNQYSKGNALYSYYAEDGRQANALHVNGGESVFSLGGQTPSDHIGILLAEADVREVLGNNVATELNDVKGGKGFMFTFAHKDYKDKDATVINNIFNELNLRAFYVDANEGNEGFLPEDALTWSANGQHYAIPAGIYLATDWSALDKNNAADKETLKTHKITSAAQFNKMTFIAVSPQKFTDITTIDLANGKGFEFAKVEGSKMNFYDTKKAKEENVFKAELESSHNEVFVGNACFTITDTDALSEIYEKTYKLTINNARLDTNKKTGGEGEDVHVSKSVSVNIVPNTNNIENVGTALNYLVSDVAANATIFAAVPSSNIADVTELLHDDATPAIYVVKFLSGEDEENSEYGQYLSIENNGDADDSWRAVTLPNANENDPLFQFVMSDVKDKDGDKKYETIKATNRQTKVSFSAVLYKEEDLGENIYTIYPDVWGNIQVAVANETTGDFEFAQKPIKGMLVQLIEKTDVDKFATFETAQSEQGLYTLEFAKTAESEDRLYAAAPRNAKTGEFDLTTSAGAAVVTSATADQFELIRVKDNNKKDKVSYILNDFVYNSNGKVVTSPVEKDTVAYYSYNVRYFAPDMEDTYYMNNGQFNKNTPSEFVIKYNVDGSVSLFNNSSALFATGTGNVKPNDKATYYFVTTELDGETVNEKNNIGVTAWNNAMYYKNEITYNKAVKTFLVPEKVYGTLNPVPQTTEFKNVDNYDGYLFMNENEAAVINPFETMTFFLDTVDVDSNVPSFYIRTADKAKFMYFAADSAESYRLTNWKKYEFENGNDRSTRLIFKNAGIAGLDTLQTTVDGKLVKVAEKQNKVTGVLGGLNNFKFQVIESGDNDGTYVIRSRAKANGYVTSINGNLTLGANIKGAARFEVDPTETVANEAINASAIQVVTTNGAIIVKGAEGKNVVITNVLGQQIANTVVSSSEATISAPAGVVVVAVEGEAAVKAIVK